MFVPAALLLLELLVNQFNSNNKTVILGLGPSILSFSKFLGDTRVQPEYDEIYYFVWRIRFFDECAIFKLIHISPLRGL